VLAWISFFSSEAQDGCRITVNFKNYPFDTLWFGHSLGKRAVPDFFALRQPDGNFVLESKEPLPAGMYAIVFKRSAGSNFSAFQCWLADGQREFSIETFFLKPYELPVVVGSQENELLYRYLRRYENLDNKLDSLINAWRYVPNEENFRLRVKGEEEIRRMQDDFIRQFPNTLMAAYIRKMQFPIPPDQGIKPRSPEEEAHDRWRWQRERFLENMDPASPDFTRYPGWIEHLDFYLFHLPPPHPDTTKILIDKVLNRLSANKEAYEYYLKYLTNSLGRMSQFQMDEVFVHVAANYVETGKVPSTSEEDRQKIMAEARKMTTLFVGKPAPDVTLFDRENKPVKLSDIKADLTMMIFWLPDCSHCKKEMPIVLEEYERYREKGLKVVAVCGKNGKETPACWSFADEQKLPADWYVLADPDRLSGVLVHYNIKTYPRIFFLDANKHILYKRAGEMTQVQMRSVLDKLTQGR
jgi:peroxiredoxin